MTEAASGRADFGALARAALERYDIPPRAELTFVRHGENATFRVDDRGRWLALRIARPGYQRVAAIRSEIAWMDALRAVGISTPETVRGRDGEVVQQIPGPERDQIVIAFEWVTGLPLPEARRTNPWTQLGQLMARIHRHGREWTAPPWFERPAWDLEALVGDCPRWGDPCPSGVWHDRDREVLLAARAAVRRRLAALGTTPDRFGLIHSDLGFENVLVTDDDRAVIIDFDDCGPSWYVYEIASVLYPLEDEERFAACRDALIVGYRREADLPDAMIAELPTFLMCRRLATLGWTFSRAETEHAQRQRAKRLRTSPRAAERFLEWDAAGGGTTV